MYKTVANCTMLVDVSGKVQLQCQIIVVCSSVQVIILVVVVAAVCVLEHIKNT